MVMLFSRESIITGLKRSVPSAASLSSYSGNSKRPPAIHINIHSTAAPARRLPSRVVARKTQINNATKSTPYSLFQAPSLSIT